ncbi:MAG TPA: efflux RND transporter periplasmic adaptor subunit [Gemmatimonadales bacterium]|nr:efflux RND transporter periplasmic adaptor subunit [Gemmatimonadales bacterium]
MTRMQEALESRDGAPGGEMRSPPRARRPFPLMVLASGSLLAGACSRQAPKPARPTVPVTVTSVHHADVPYTIEANGLVAPMQTAAVAAQVDGIITQVGFREGQEVTRGQMLFQIDPRPYQAAFDQARANLTRDKASADNAAREADRYTVLETQGFATKEEADQQRAAASVAEATVTADQAALATARFNLDNATIRAPIPGRTGSLLVRVGNLVHASSGTPLVVINQIQPILVRFSVPSTELALIRRYAATGTLPVEARPGAPLARTDTAMGDRPAGTSLGRAGGDSTDPPRGRSPFTVGTVSRGNLSFIDNAIDTTTGTLMLKATFPNSDEALWVGQFVATSLRLFVEKDALVVPAAAVITGQQGLSAYIVDSTGAAQLRRVTVERTAGGVAIIASGLAEGDRVVTDGQSRLAPGVKVTLKTGTAAAVPAAAATSRRGKPAP